MNSSRDELLFQLALTKPVEERAVWLDRECAGDKSLRQGLEALLAAFEKPKGVLIETTADRKGTLKIELREEAGDEAWGKPAQAVEWKKKLAVITQASQSAQK